MWRKEGFTLIELMIVIAIIAIIAAIAIPNLVGSKKSANEGSAAASLKLFVTSEATWYQGDNDGNGRKDYWTYDVSCLHRMYKADGASKMALIAIDLARADAACATMDQSTATFGVPTIENWAAVVTSAKSGYWFRAMLFSDAAGTDSYKVNTVGTNAVAAAHSSNFGFMAAPDAWGSSGDNSFIVNQEGTVYKTDTGGNANKWFTANAGDASTNVCRWPGANPAGITGKGGRMWSVAD
ncbi:MAG: DUF2950 family protein [Planctomycetota bacterium]|nr:DUF2950 family protein [Planctomycetota bacterium]MDI6787508.1 DUF2950 family protein [Planctomycetota bacterium]